jgi:hypothetical protein
MRDHAAIKAMAQRQLDGMTVNRDLMAQDVLDLLAQIERNRESMRFMALRLKQLEPKPKTEANASAPRSMDAILKDLEDLFGPKK